MGQIKRFTDLLAWRKSYDLALYLYKLTEAFPREEVFGLTNQMRRSAISISSNIAEGFSRQTYKDKVNFYSIAHGSLTELQSQILIARGINYLNKNDFDDLVEKIVEAQKILCGLIKSSKKR